MDAKLTMSDRQGCLDVSDKTMGASSQVGVEYLSNRFDIFIEGGYRWLKFTNVFQDPKDGFTTEYGGLPMQPGYFLPPLDYSGFFIRFGGRWR